MQGKEYLSLKISGIRNRKIAKIDFRGLGILSESLMYISGKSCRAPSISPGSGFSRGMVTGLPPLQLQNPLILGLTHLAQSPKTPASHRCAALCSSRISWCSANGFQCPNNVPSLFCICDFPSRSTKPAKFDYLLEFSPPTEPLDSTAPGLYRVAKRGSSGLCDL